MTRLLGVDLGDKRTGLAAGDTETASVFPLSTLHVPRGEALVAAVATEAAQHDAEAIVLGLPLNMDGTEGPRATLTRTFGEQLQGPHRPDHLLPRRATDEFRSRAPAPRPARPPEAPTPTQRQSSSKSILQHTDLWPLYLASHQRLRASLWWPAVTALQGGRGTSAGGFQGLRRGWG